MAYCLLCDITFNAKLMGKKDISESFQTQSGNARGVALKRGYRF